MRDLKIACALLLLLFAAGPLRAQDSDPLKSPECGAALARLQAARADKGDARTVESLRSEAANTCLGHGAPPTRPGRTAQVPIGVPPPQIDVPAARAPLAAPAPPPPPVAIERFPTPATCDANGCWANDGSTHLRHVPPNLTGPLCTQQGGALYCP